MDLWPHVERHTAMRRGQPHSLSGSYASRRRWIPIAVRLDTGFQRFTPCLKPLLGTDLLCRMYQVGVGADLTLRGSPPTVLLRDTPNKTRPARGECHAYEDVVLCLRPRVIKSRAVRGNA